jgi:endonuclease IV
MATDNPQVGTRRIGTAVHKLDNDSWADALVLAKSLGSTATQFMLHPPKSYARTGPLEPGLAEAIIDNGFDGGGMFHHASMFCTLTRPPSDNKQRLSLRALFGDLRDCDALGMVGTVVHPGRWRDTHEGRNLVTNVEICLSSYHGSAKLLLETSVHGMHSTPEQLAWVINQLPPTLHKNVGIVIDTAHMIAAGIDLRNEHDIEAFIKPYTEHVDLVHLNNPRHPLGSKRDGHGRIVDGWLSPSQWLEMVTRLNGMLPSTVPFVIESTDSLAEVWNVRNICDDNVAVEANG